MRTLERSKKRILRLICSINSLKCRSVLKEQIETLDPRSARKLLWNAPTHTQRQRCSRIEAVQELAYLTFGMPETFIARLVGTTPNRLVHDEQYTVKTIDLEVFTQEGSILVIPRSS